MTDPKSRSAPHRAPSDTRVGDTASLDTHYFARVEPRGSLPSGAALPDLPDLHARRPPPGWLTPLLTAISVVSLALNGYVAWTLQHSSKTVTVGEKTATSATTAPSARQTVSSDGPDASSGRLPRRADPDQRLAALLAVSGDADRCRKLLDTLTPAECSELGQMLVARSAASDRNGALTAVIASLAATEPARAVALLDAVQENVLRATLARQLAEVWTAKDPKSAANWLATDGMRFLDASAASAPLLRAVTQWSTFDPEGATLFTAAQPASDRGPLARALGVASRAWGQLNAPAALAWARALPLADPRRAQSLGSVWEGWTERDPAAAGAALRQQLYSGGNRPPVEIAGTVARQWTQADPPAAAQWALSLNDGARANALTQVATAWAQTDPPAAAQWAATLPPSGVRGTIWKEVVTDWEDGDAPATATWLGGLPLGRDHDEAIGAYLPKIEPTDPQKALEWAGTVGDATLRSEQVQSVLGRWVRRDPVAARNWAAANGVPILAARTAAQ